VTQDPQAHKAQRVLPVRLAWPDRQALRVHKAHKAYKVHKVRRGRPAHRFV